jgi:putative heme-binding domain-containing protein
MITSEIVGSRICPVHRLRTACAVATTKTVMMKRLFSILCSFSFASAGMAQQLSDKDPRPLSAAEQLTRFKAPAGFTVQLVADETQIQKPININFDPAGRLWVTGSTLYPWPASTDASGKPIPNFEKAYDELASAFGAKGKAPPFSKEGKDTVRVLSGFNAQGRATEVRVFADRLNIPTGIQPLPRTPDARGDSIIVYSIPNIWRMTDSDGDGTADQREVLYGPFGFLDTHGDASSFNYWLDGWIYGTHGFRNHSEVKDRAGHVVTFDSGNTYRFRADGSKIEYWSHGQTNPFGLTFDSFGNLYSADCHSKPVYLLLRGGYYEGIGKQHDGLGFAPAITNDDHGSSGICGIACYEAAQFPEEYRGDLFVGNCVTGRINRDKLEWHGSTPKAIRQPDFLTCADPWFRPVDVKLGPDGALYIADFYNYIIGHYEVPLTDPRRDNTRGRIWRVVWTGSETQTPPPSPTPVSTPAIPDLTKLDADALIAQFGNSNSIVATLATNEFVARFGNGGTSNLARTLTGEPATSSGRQRVHALWALSRITPPDAAARSALALKNDDPLVRANAVRLLGEQPALPDESRKAIAAACVDESAAVQRAAMSIVARQNGPSVLETVARVARAARAPDAELQHASRIALRDLLLKEGGYAAADRLLKTLPDCTELIADVSLGAPTPASAAWLLAHLEQTRLETARAGDYLRHVLLYSAAPQLERIAALVKGASHAALAQRIAIAEAFVDVARKRNESLPEQINAWIGGTVTEALSTKEPALLRKAIAAVRGSQLEAKVVPLVTIISDAKRAEPLRVEALDAVGNMVQARVVVAAALNDPSSMALRKRAAEWLGQSNARETRDLLLRALATAPWELATTIAAGLVKSDEGCAELLAFLESGKTSPALLRNNAVAGLLEKRSEALKKRAASLTRDLPPEDARLDQLIAQRASEFHGAAADLSHGAAVFQQQCFVCHRLKGEGGNIGPNLDGVGVRGLHRLLEDILDPNRNVDPSFRQTVIETNDGRTVAGVNLRAEGELVVLNDVTGKEQSVLKKDIKTQTGSRLSLMPPTFEQTLSGKDLNDLVAYLLAQTNAGAKSPIE